MSEELAHVGGATVRLLLAPSALRPYVNHVRVIRREVVRKMLAISREDAADVREHAAKGPMKPSRPATRDRTRPHARKVSPYTRFGDPAREGNRTSR
jgi:hypothetical protein